MLVFLFEKPSESYALDLDSAVDDVEIDAAANSFLWPDNTPAPMLAIGQSRENRKHYKVFRYPEEMEKTDFDWTHLYFGGIFAASSWERFEQYAKSEPYFTEVPDEPIEQDAVGGSRI